MPQRSTATRGGLRMDRDGQSGAQPRRGRSGAGCGRADPILRIFPARITYAINYNIFVNNRQFIEDQAGIAIADGSLEVPPRDVTVAFEKIHIGQVLKQYLEFDNGQCTGTTRSPGAAYHAGTNFSATGAPYLWHSTMTGARSETTIRTGNTESDGSAPAAVRAPSPIGVIAVLLRLSGIVAVVGGSALLRLPRILTAIAMRDQERRDTAIGEAAAACVQRLGPVFIKVAQMMSYRADLLPAAMLAPLAVLQDRVRPLAPERRGAP